MNRFHPFFFFTAALWTAAFFLSLPVAQPLEITRLGAVLCAFAAAYLMIAKALRDGVRLSGAGLLDAALLFWGWMFASVFWSEAVNISFMAFCTFSLLPLAFFALALAREQPPALAGASVIVAGLALWALAQYFFLPGLLEHGGVRRPFANPNSYAALMGLGVFLGLGASAQPGWKGRTGAALAALTLCALLTTGSRGALLALLPCLGACLFLMRRHLKKARLLLAALAVGIFIAAALAVPRDYYAGPLQRLTQTEASSYGSIDNRLDIWRATAAMIEEHPWRGTGIGTFFLYYPAHRPQTDVSSSGLMAHSDPLQFWQEAGIAAPLLFYAFLLLAGWRMISALRFIAPDNPQRPMIAALFCGLAALIAHSHADFSLNMAPLLLLAGLMLGRWFGLTGVHPDVEIALPRRWPAAAQWSVVAAPFLLAAVFAQGFFRSEYYAGRAQELALSGDVAAFAAAVNISDKAGFGLNARAYMMAATLPLGMLQNGASSLSPAEKAAQEAQAEKMLDLAQAHNPRLSPVYFYRAQLEDAAGDKAVAKAQLERGLAINPLHQPSRVMLAGLLLGEGAEDEAYAVLLAGLHWPPRFQDPTPYYDMVMMLADKRGDKETAALVAAKAADYAQRQKTRPTFPQQY